MNRIEQAEKHAQEIANHLYMALLVAQDENCAEYDPLLAMALREKRDKAFALRDELNAIKQAIAKRK